MSPYHPFFGSTSYLATKTSTMTEKNGRKRGRPPANSTKDGGDDENNNLSRRQAKRAALKAQQSSSYYTPKKIIVDVSLEKLMPQERIDLIADLSESILEDPNEALTSSRVAIGGGGGTSKSGKYDNNNEEGTTKKEPLYHKTQSKMNKLLDLATLTNNGHDAHAARLALLSLLAIFQDILPSYRIRLPTENEMSVRVSKDIKATWDYERKLLQSYQRYLQLLEKTWEDGKFGRRWEVDDSGKKKKGNTPQGGGGGPPTTLAATSILALSALLQTNYNFNFRSNLLQIVVRQANNRSSDEVRTSCCNALSTMFTRDLQGEASLEAVRLMSKMIKQQLDTNNNSSKAIHPDVLNTWLSLPLRVHEDEAMAAKLATAAKAKKAKKSQADKDTLDIEKEMKEGEATVDKLELAKNQADTLHAVTLTYFRILKLVASTTTEIESAGGQKTNSAASELLPCALRGLAKFSHLIHLDAVVDLLAVLKELLKNVSSLLSPDAAVHCILCALKTLRGPGRDALPVDPKEYLIPLYNLLPRLGIARNGSDLSGDEDVDEKTVEAAIQCLDHAFLQRRELSTSRLAAFVKRLSSTALHCPPHLATPLLACARQISARYASQSSSKVGRMLENEEDVVAEGMFSPEAEDPEHSNAHATSLWELSLMKYSIHPKVAEHSLSMAEGKLLKLPGEAPGKICTSMCRDVKEVYISQKVVWKKHPLDNTHAQLPKETTTDDGGGDSRRAKMYEEAAAAEISRKKRRQLRRNQNQVRFITPRRTGQWHLLPPTSSSLL